MLLIHYFYIRAEKIRYGEKKKNEFFKKFLVVIGKIMSTTSKSGDKVVHKTRLTHRLLIKGKEMNSNQILFLILNQRLLHAEIVSTSFLWLPEKYTVLKSPRPRRIKGEVERAYLQGLADMSKEASLSHQLVMPYLPKPFIVTVCLLMRPNLDLPFLWAALHCRGWRWRRSKVAEQTLHQPAGKKQWSR